MTSRESLVLYVGNYSESSVRYILNNSNFKSDKR